MVSINKHFWDDGFTVTYDDGVKESFRKEYLGDSFLGDKGSKIGPHVLDEGFTINRYDGMKESFRKNILDDNYTGDKGTHINKNWLDDNYHSYNHERECTNNSSISRYGGGNGTSTVEVSDWDHFKNGVKTLKWILVVVIIIAFAFAEAIDELTYKIQEIKERPARIEEAEESWNDFCCIVENNIAGVYEVTTDSTFRDADEEELFDHLKLYEDGSYEYVGYYSYYIENDEYMSYDDEQVIEIISQSGKYTIYTDQLSDEEYLTESLNHVAIIFSPENTSGNLRKDIGNDPFLSDAEVKITDSKLTISGIAPEIEADYCILNGPYVGEKNVR